MDRAIFCLPAWDCADCVASHFTQFANEFFVSEKLQVHVLLKLKHKPSFETLHGRRFLSEARV